MNTQRRSPRFSALTWRIIFFNTVALVILIGGVLLVQTSGRSLIDERVSGIRQQAQIVASTLAEYATDEDSRTVKDDDAESLLRQLIAPT
ncbi:MAG TPA: sensor N-terminal transmembrane domain-containing protein, partial [Rhizomicrobium sp.]